MILSRLGNKRKIAEKIWKLFPEHNAYAEPFFGAGGMFFSKPKVKYNFLNDLDDDVFNLFQVVLDDEDKLRKILTDMPVHSSLLNYWKKNKETDPIRKAARFLLISNFSINGNSSSIHVRKRNSKKIMLERISKTKEALSDAILMNFSYDKFINSIEIRWEYERKNFLFYCDPPYINCVNGHSHLPKFTENDFENLLEALINKRCKFAVSEFDNDFVLKCARKRKLKIIEIGERQNLKNRRKEILIVNYDPGEIREGK